MLINVPYRPNDVVTIKLSTGEELIGKYLSDEKDAVAISKPLVLTAGQQGGLALTPYMFTAEVDTVMFKNQHIICITSSLKQASDQYFKATSGIELAPASMLQGL